MPGDITSANAVITLSIPGLYDAPQQLQGFAAEDIFESDAIDTAELKMGADGLLSSGFIFVGTPWRVILQADSESNDIFDNWNGAEQQAIQKLAANGTVLLTSINRKWTMTRGFLTSYMTMPNAKKVLDPRTFGLMWQRVRPAPVA